MVPVEIGARDSVQWIWMAFDGKYIVKARGMLVSATKSWFSIRLNGMGVRVSYFPWEQRCLFLTHRKNMDL